MKRAAGWAILITLALAFMVLTSMAVGVWWVGPMILVGGLSVAGLILKALEWTM